MGTSASQAPRYEAERIRSQWEVAINTRIAQLRKRKLS
jgi:hypothetical protein